MQKQKMPMEASTDERPVATHDKADAARDALFARLRAQPVQDIGRWRRDELYEDRRGQSRAMTGSGAAAWAEAARRIVAGEWLRMEKPP